MLQPHRILVIHVTRIGDTLLTTPVIRALAAAWPEAEITFAGHRKRIEVMENLPYIHHLVGISKLTAPWLGYFGGQHFDLAVVFGNDVPLVKYALRVSDRVVATRQNDEAVNRRLFAIAREDGYIPRHAVTGLLTLLRPLHLPPAGYRLDYRVTEAEQQWAIELLDQSRISGRPLVGLQLASFPTKSYRDWPVESFVALCERIVAAFPEARFLVFGGPADKARSERLEKALGARVNVFAGRLSLRQTAALMNQLDLYIGVDTGPTHIMGALHRPMVALYHPTAPSRALAPQEHPCCFAVDHQLADDGATFDTPMAEIPVETVWENVRSALEGVHPPPRTPEWMDYPLAASEVKS